MSNLSLIAALFVLSNSVLASESFQTVYSCSNGSDSIILLQKEEQYQLHAMQCLDKECYLVRQAYGTVELTRTSSVRLEGNALIVIEDLENKSVTVSGTEAKIPKGNYYRCR